MDLTGTTGSSAYGDAHHGDGDHESELADEGEHARPSHESDPEAAAAAQDPPAEEESPDYYGSDPGKHFPRYLSLADD
jgi:hypothetical protein